VSGAGRPAIDFVSPLPPVRSGIADYSADLLPALEELCDLRVVRLDGQEIAPEIAERWQPVPTREIGTGERLPLYQMGNNQFHDQILDLAPTRPGVLTLHDLFLHHLLFERTLAHGDHQPYRDALRHDHGWIGQAVAEPPRWGAHGLAQLFELPCHRRLVQSQRGILVHSRWAAERLLEEVGEVAVRVIPMPMPLEQVPPPETGAELRRRFGIPSTAPVIGSFGFQTPIKRTDVVIAALARPELHDVHLLAVGQATRSFDLAEHARQAGVADRVHLGGWLERAEMSAAMATTDLCVNLRYPTAGETSASLLRLLALGRPTLVSDYAQFAELPSDCVLKVPLGEDEVEELARQVRQLLDDPAELAARGRRSRDWIASEHDPARVAELIVQACAELGARQPAVATALRAARPSSLTFGVTQGSVCISGADSWRESERRQVEIRLRNESRCRWLATRRGPGGVSLRLELHDETGRDLYRDRPWATLPHDLGPGESFAFQLLLRRPLGKLEMVATPMLTTGLGYEPLQVEPCRLNV
jgi:glycosyltransferase involved in cell wall biosynthesis